MPPKFLLIQARVAADVIAQHEVDCFVERFGVQAEKVTTHKLIVGSPTMAMVRRHDAVLVERFDAYLAGYAQTMSLAQQKAARQGFAESLHASRLLRGFVEQLFPR